MLPGAVVLDAGRVDAALEVVLGRRRRRENAPDDGQLLESRAVGSAEQRDLTVVEVGPGADDGERLERLRRRAQIRDVPGVAGRELDPAAADGDGVDHMPRLDDLAPRDLDDDRLHGAGA